ncbi:MAG: hypothetical protein IIX39_00635 [Clostridia bacterium]|nr:hypothetical protein [Clostridia bacterium]
MKKNFLNEDGSFDFENFNQLNESKQIQLMETWTPQQWLEYRMQNTISEEECFTPIFELINELENMKKNGRSI